VQYLILGWSEYKADLLQQRVVQPLQTFLTQQLQVSTKYSPCDVISQQEQLSAVPLLPLQS